MFFAIVVNKGTPVVVEADNKAAANAYIQTLVDVEIRAAGSADFGDTPLSAVPRVLKGGKTQAMLNAEAAEKQAKAEKAAAKKAAVTTV